MVTLRERIERLEEELRFRIWIREHRFFESLSSEELEAWAVRGDRPEREEPASGMSALDNMERKELQKLWKEDERKYEGRNREEKVFYILHGHWPEQGCGTNCTKSHEDQ
jgi:hypothetical protein